MPLTASGFYQAPERVQAAQRPLVWRVQVWSDCLLVQQRRLNSPCQKELRLSGRWQAFAPIAPHSKRSRKIGAKVYPRQPGRLIG